MAHELVAEHVDDRGAARLEGALELWHQLIRRLDVLSVASHLGKDAIVTDALEDIERFGAALQRRHQIEARSPRAVVPQQADDRKLVARGRLHIPTADS